MERRRNESGSARAVRPLNPDFAFLALRAAVELDDIIRGKAGQPVAVMELAKSLRDTTSAIGASPALTSLADPLSADLLNRALEQGSPTQQIDTVKSLIQRANEVASSLQQATPKSGAKQLEILRNFCLALSQVTSSYRQEERERMRPQHPQRH